MYSSEFNRGVSIDLNAAMRFRRKYFELTERFEGLSLPQVCALMNVELVFTTNVDLGDREPGRIYLNSVLEPDEQRAEAIIQIASLELSRVVS